jgi:hypothetical protein
MATTQTAANWAAHYRILTVDQLIAATGHLEVAVKWGEATVPEIRFAALEAEQHRRCVASKSVARSLARTEQAALDGEEAAEAFTGERHPDYHRMDALLRLTQHERQA